MMLGNHREGGANMATRRQSTQEQNKAIARRYIEEVVNKKNLSLIDELYSPNHVFRINSEEPALGLEGVRQIYNTFVTAFPDLHLAIEDIIAEGDKVVVPYTARGTHQGELMGITPTGKQVNVPVIAIIRFAGGKIVETRHIFDALVMMQQLGAIPSQ